MKGGKPVGKGGESRKGKRRERWRGEGESCAASFSSYSPVFAKQLNGSVKEPNSSIYFFFHQSLSGVLFPMFCLLAEGECQILVF